MSENTVTVVDPATEKPIAELPLGGVEAVDGAVARATRAFPAWRAVSPGDRARLMRRFATAVEDSAEELAQLETANVGKPISDSRDEVAMVAEVLHFYAGAVDKHRGATVPVAAGVDLTFNEPLGVVAAIVPWNFPIAITSWKVGPALATGNTVVVKPAELTPLTALRLEALALEAGIPPGVLQVVVGTGPVAGARLVEHPDVAKVAFTGSTAVGRQVMASASRTIKRVTLELGGKSANIVFADADLERAAAAAPGGVFANAGQDCCARSRILVERSVFDRFLELLAEAVQAWRVGDPRDPATQMGPLASSNRRDVVARYLAPGMGDPGGGPVEPFLAGAVPDGPGFWFPPTVVAPAENHWRLAAEEIFGPIVAVIPFEGEDEAVRLANDTPYGLSGSIWTRHGSRALRMARAVEVGNLSINSNGSVRVQTSFGGMKQSGFGRELGLEALGSYSEVKNVFYATEA
jgi:betaine-aldehyde dehydrogenase